MKSMRRPIARDDNAETLPIASSLPRSVFLRMERLCDEVGITKAMFFRRAACKYIQEMEERRLGPR